MSRRQRRIVVSPPCSSRVGHVSAWWLLFVPTTFYLLYGVEWLISYVYHILQGDARDRWNDAAYHASAFEMEAYAHEAEANYLSSRRWFAFVKYYENSDAS